MGKIPDNELKELARIYNEKGKKEMYALLVEKYGIKNPTCVFNRMCKKPELAYDKEQKCFFAEYSLQGISNHHPHSKDSDLRPSKALK